MKSEYDKDAWATIEMMLGDVLIIASAILLGLRNGMSVLYQTRRTGHAWAGSILTTVVATGAFGGLLVMALLLSGSWAHSLGKDEDAVHVLRGLFATGIMIYVTWALQRTYQRWWPTREDHKAAIGGKRPQPQTGGADSCC